MSYQMKDMAERTNPKGADGRKYLKESKDGVSYSLHCVDVETFPDKVTLGKCTMIDGRASCSRAEGNAGENGVITKPQQQRKK